MTVAELKRMTPAQRREFFANLPRENLLLWMDILCADLRNAENTLRRVVANMSAPTSNPNEPKRE